MDSIINETVISYNEYLRNLPFGCQAIADDIRAEEYQLALNKILQFVEGVSWLITVNELLDKNGFENVMDLTQAKEFLLEINSGLEIQDYIVVADMFEYEIKPFFESCKPYEIQV